MKTIIFVVSFVTVCIAAAMIIVLVVIPVTCELEKKSKAFWKQKINGE